MESAIQILREINFREKALSHTVEKRQFLSHQKKIREINSLATSLAHCFHKITPILDSRTTVWKLRKFTLTLFWQKIRESNIFTLRY